MMRTLMIVAVFAVLTLNPNNSDANKSIEAEYTPLLKRLAHAACAHHNHALSEKERKKAGQEMIAVEMELGPLRGRPMKSSTFMKFNERYAMALSNRSCLPKPNKGAWRPLVKQVRDSGCAIMMYRTDPQKHVPAQQALRDANKKLMAIENELREHDPKELAVYRKAKFNADIGIDPDTGIECGE